MSSPRANRRRFLKSSLTTAASVAWASTRPGAVSASGGRSTAAGPAQAPERAAPSKKPRLRFAVIGVNHGHINRQVEAVIRGGGALVAFFAKEPDLAAAFAKRYPQAKLARSEREILEDPDDPARRQRRHPERARRRSASRSCSTARTTWPTSRA